MDALKQIFPISYSYTKDGKSLAIGIIIQLVVGLIAGAVIWVAGLLTTLPLVGALIAWVLRIAGGLVDVYVIAGIVIQILVYTKVIKD